jgi:CheY-like chemotaxis protein
MPEKLLLSARWLAVLVLLLSIVLILARWKYPQKRESSRGTLALWREIWRQWRKSRSREKQRETDLRALRGKSVLVADPDEKSSRVLVWRLESLGCKVSKTRNGTQALSLAALERPDVAIVDALLSDVSAIDFFNSLPPPKAPVVFVGTLQAQREELRRLEGVACLGKPFDPEDAVVLAGKMLRQADLTPTLSCKERESGI